MNKGFKFWSSNFHFFLKFWPRTVFSKTNKNLKKTYKNLQKPTFSYIFLHFLKIDENRWKSMKIDENRWILKKPCLIKTWKKSKKFKKKSKKFEKKLIPSYQKSSKIINQKSSKIIKMFDRFVIGFVVGLLIGLRRFT